MSLTTQLKKLALPLAAAVSLSSCAEMQPYSPPQARGHFPPTSPLNEYGFGSGPQAYGGRGLSSKNEEKYREFVEREQLKEAKRRYQYEHSDRNRPHGGQNVGDAFIREFQRQAVREAKNRARDLFRF